MKVAIACDHHGILLKEKIIKDMSKSGFDFVDYGPNIDESVDYPDYAFKVGKAVKIKNVDLGILLCNTGIGMSIACNKVKGIRCAKIDNVEEAELCKLHNNANVITFSANKDYAEIIEMISTFLKTEYVSVERHQRRIDKITNYEKGVRNEL